MAFLDLSDEGVSSVVNEIVTAGGVGLAISCNVADESSVISAVKQAATLGRINVVCNVAGVGGFAHTQEQSLEGWNRIVGVNLTGTFLVCRETIPYLLDGGGVIVNVTSVNSRLPAEDAASYSALKAALLNVGKAVATEYAAKGVRVVTVSPGLTATPMWLGSNGVASQIAVLQGSTPDEVAQATATSTPLRRFITPEEIANCICFIASPRASAVTGAELVVDGGLTPTI